MSGFSNCLQEMGPPAICPAAAAFDEEWNTACRQLIVDNFQWFKQCTGRACPLPCVFGNLEGCIPEGTISREDPYAVKFHNVDKAPLYRTQYCFTHNGQCSLFPRNKEEGISVTMV